MAAYVLADIEVTDPATYEEYRRQVLPVVQKYGGRFVARGGRVEPKEGGWTPKRMIILEFPSMERALQWYDSADYGPLIALRQKASKGRLVIVEGV